MTDWQNSVLTGDCTERLADLPASSVHMCMTSPPYFGLRDYGVDGQIGLEDSLDEYISELVAVGDALRRVLRDDGSWWLNLGDSYAGGGRTNHDKSGTAPDGEGLPRGHSEGAFGRKNKMLVPHRVAIALQEAGWVVRNDVTWVKPNPMPSSVKDRLNTTTEQIFHLTPAPDYWYDLDAIREPHKNITRDCDGDTRREGWQAKDEQAQHFRAGNNPAGKNPGDVFEVTTKPFPDAHFAVYPPELCEKPIKATAPPKVCVDCGAPYDRDVERKGGPSGKHQYYADKTDACKAAEANNQRATGGTLSSRYRKHGYPERIHKGWTQPCDCDTDATEPGIVLDPFAGAGTTLLKAKDLGRRFVGIELNPEYADMARARVGLAPDDPSNVRDDDAQQGLEAFR